MCQSGVSLEIECQWEPRRPPHNARDGTTRNEKALDGSAAMGKANCEHTRTVWSGAPEAEVLPVRMVPTVIVSGWRCLPPSPIPLPRPTMTRWITRTERLAGCSPLLSVGPACSARSACSACKMPA